jgi:PAS domain-containing protein
MRTFELPSRLDVVSTEAIGDPALLVNTFGIVVSCNKEAARLLGRPTHQILGRRCAAVVRGSLPTGELVCTADCPLVQGWGAHPGPPAVEMLVPRTGARSNWRTVVVHHIPVKDVQGRASGVMHLFKPHGESPPDVTTPDNYLG